MSWNLPKILGNYKLVPTVFLGTASFTKVLAANPNRWGLFIATPAAGVFIFPNGPPSTGSGIAVTSNAFNIALKYTDNPGLTTSEWWCNAGIGNPVYFFEEIYVGK